MADADQADSEAKGQSDQWSDEELRKRYRAAFAALPRFTQKIFWAHRIDDLSYPEIAKRYGIGIREVERQIARAIYRIDRALNEQPPRGRWWRWR